jgi:fumarylacetoacetate (FAA) hydrolase family protein
MNKFPIKITGTSVEEKLQKGVFIFIYRASKIPPHIGLIANGKLYDITSVGPSIDIAVADFHKTAVKRKTEVLFVELKPSKIENLTEIITEKVKKHYKVTLETSCLTPVKAFIQEAYQIEVLQTHFIFELLPVLFQHHLIANVWELNLAHKIKNQTFEMKKYTKQDVENCVAALHRKEQLSCE